MEPERWREIERLFLEAVENPPADRAAFLAGATAGDAALCRDVERLLAADQEGRSFLERPALDHLSGLVPAGEEELSRGEVRLGPYRLLRPIGQGGMGVVYLATRDDEQFDRLVAIKVLPQGSALPDSRARLLEEMQILARLEHPGIARLYDGGGTGLESPFLVMEYVEGLPIDEYCDRRRLSIGARLALFCRVCAAVQYAHQNLLVHRDLKPGNILVTAEGEPKLLDFGLAKRLAAERSGADRALTHTGLRPMTPGYASPEQVKGEPITTASDIYSLGVLLFELLTGLSPYRLEGRAYGIEQAICEQEPERPSLAVLRPSLSRRAGDGTVPPTAEELSSARKARPRSLAWRLRGDLDNIVLTALRKEPRRRYGSVADLAGDLERHLQELPVAARRDSLGYRARKFVARHRLAVTAAGLVAMLVAGLVLRLTVQGRRLTVERDKARSTLALLVDTLKNADPYRRGGRDLTVPELLGASAEGLPRRLSGQPELEANVMDAIGQVYLGLGMVRDAAPLLEQALELRRHVFGDEHLETARSRAALGDLRYGEGRYKAAENLYREALAAEEAALGTRHPEVAATLNQLGSLLSLLHRYEEAEDLHRRALVIYQSAPGEGQPEMADTLIQLAKLSRDQGSYDEARHLYEQGLALQRGALGDEHPTVALTLSTLALVLMDQGDHAGAERLLRQALAVERRSLPDDHPDLVNTVNNLALSLHALGNFSEAETLFREVLAVLQELLGGDHVRVATVLNNLGAVLLAQGKLRDAGRSHEEALRIRRRAFGEDHDNVAQSLLQLARVRHASGATGEAESLSRRSLAIFRGNHGDSHPFVSYPLTELGRLLLDRGEPAAAEELLRQSLAIRREAYAPQHFELARAKSDLGACLVALGRYAEAEPLLIEAHATLAGQFAAGDGRVAEVRRRLEDLHRAWDEPPGPGDRREVGPPTPPPTASESLGSSGSGS